MENIMSFKELRANSTHSFLFLSFFLSEAEEATPTIKEHK